MIDPIDPHVVLGASPNRRLEGTLIQKGQLSECRTRLIGPSNFFVVDFVYDTAFAQDVEVVSDVMLLNDGIAPSVLVVQGLKRFDHVV
jgi:hypothetical protein